MQLEKGFLPNYILVGLELENGHLVIRKISKEDEEKENKTTLSECVPPSQHFHHLNCPEVVVEVVRKDRQCRCKSHEGRGAGTTITNIL